MLCMLKNCGKCGGDLVMDDGDWRCVQCAICYYGSLAEATEPHEQVAAKKVPEPVGKTQRNRYNTRATRNVNSLVQARVSSDSRWWSRNKEVIDYLDQGLSVGAISTLTSRGPRQIRTIREQLSDMRAGDELNGTTGG